MKKTTPILPVAIGALAIVALLLAIDFSIETFSNGTVNAEEKSVSTSNWGTYTHADLFEVKVPRTWKAAGCGDDMLAYLSPVNVSCGAGLRAIGIQEHPTNVTVDNRVTYWNSALTNILAGTITVNGASATRIRGTTVGSLRRVDVFLLSKNGRVWEITNTLTGNDSVFRGVYQTFRVTAPAANTNAG